jgi:FkbM family methyltransferase
MNFVELLFGWNSLSIWNREVEVWGRRFGACSFDRLLNLYLHRFGLMGKEDKHIFAEFIRPGMTVVDIGANQGLYALLFGHLVGPKGRVFAFEPAPELFDSLEGNCRRNKAHNVHVHNLALGSESGTLMLCRSRVNAGDNRLAKSKRMDWFKEVPVRVTTLDQILGPTRVDLVKIDVQGWELEVLKGMDQLLRTNPGLRIYFEFWQYGLRQAGCDPLEVFDYLQARSFRIHERAAGVWRAIDNPTSFCSRLNGHKYVNLFAVSSAGNL